MEENYRIKEVKIPLKSGVVTVYYPQVKSYREETTGKLWWKKKVKKEDWFFLYNSSVGTLIDLDNVEEKIYYHELEDAVRFIKQFKQNLIERAKDSWSKLAYRWNDDDLVKYHKVE
jgi:hypothetical protein